MKSIDAETLMYKVIDKPVFLVDQLIPFGLTIFCGAQKIGKSWLMLDLCYKVSEGKPFLGFDTCKSDVLYMCLEDTMARIQRRLFRITDTASPGLHFTNEIHRVSEDLITNLENFVHDHPNVRLIVIDTLQKVRGSSNDAAYAHDYNELSQLKLFADTYHIALVIVHHTRKVLDPDIFNMILGTNGIAGCADTTIVLQRENRGAEVAKLHITGRDVEQQVIDMRIHGCVWSVTGRKTKQEEALEAVPEAVQAAVLLACLSDNGEWKGSASDLCKELGAVDINPNVIAKQLNQFHSTYLADKNIKYSSGRTHAGRYICLKYEPAERDDGDSSDGNTDIATDSDAAVTATEPYPEVPPSEDAPC